MNEEGRTMNEEPNAMELGILVSVHRSSFVFFEGSECGLR